MVNHPENSRTPAPQSMDDPAKVGRLKEVLGRHVDAANATRRGICLLNAGKAEQALNAFQTALACGGCGRSLPALMSACLRSLGNVDAAVDEARKADAASHGTPSARIRLAHLLVEQGKRDEAIAILRDAISEDRENAELHFQIGILLAASEEHEEAELRFGQALSIDRNHSEASINLALCCGVRHAPEEAVFHLQNALRRRPLDARIGMLLAQATAAAQQSGRAVQVRATIPKEDWLEDANDIEELSRLIEREPDFVDAFIALPASQMDSQVHAVLLRTLEQALENQPEHAELHYHCGQVLAKMGRSTDAISQNETAVRLNPRCTRALIDLAKLYRATDRRDDAVQRLEQAVAHGANYADVHYLLGTLYRDQGRLHLARRAYHKALRLNNHFAPAQQALAELPS